MSYGDLLALLGFLCIVLAFGRYFINEEWPKIRDRFVRYNEANDDIANGRVERFDSVENMIQELKQ